MNSPDEYEAARRIGLEVHLLGGNYYISSKVAKTNSVADTKNGKAQVGRRD